jgi:hypothetical protein
MTRAKFWAWAVGVALGFALLSALLLPYGWLGLHTEALRWRAWLLTLWTGGAMSVLFGLAGILGYRVPPGVREVLDAGGVGAAMEARKRAREEGRAGNFALWTVCMGLCLIAIYFVAWFFVRDL